MPSMMLCQADLENLLLKSPNVTRYFHDAQHSFARFPDTNLVHDLFYDTQKGIICREDSLCPDRKPHQHLIIRLTCLTTEHNTFRDMPWMDFIKLCVTDYMHDQLHQQCHSACQELTH